VPTGRPLIATAPWPASAGEPAESPEPPSWRPAPLSTTGPVTGLIDHAPGHRDPDIDADTDRDTDRAARAGGDGDGPVVGSLCTGYGGLDLAVLEVLGGRVGWCADPDPHVQVITGARLPGAPNLGDITRVDWARVRRVDVISAGFPCEDLSAAGKGAGIKEGTRSGLWISVAAAVRALRPQLVFVENVEALRWRRPGLGRVLGDLAQAGYDTCWCCVRASDLGLPHRRERMFLLAHPTPRPGRPTRRPPCRSSGQAPGRAPGRAPCRPVSRVSARAGGAVVAHRAGRGLPTQLATGLPRGAAPSGPALRCGQHVHTPPRVDPAGVMNPERHNTRVDWGPYTSAIRRWETVSGRPAPFPTEATASGRLGVRARWVEWLMGLPAGWVTDLPIPRSAQIRALGRGVIPQQGAFALRQLLTLIEPTNLTRQPAWSERSAA
jgi:DNA (cytosine-5)-methyltransferase 1